MGLINQRYALAMHEEQVLQVRSWHSRLQLRFAKTIPFNWRPGVWYRMKFQSENAGNAAVLRQPRNIRNLKTVAESLKADYVLLGQLQKGEGGLRFITHFIRLRDEAHLKANRLTMPGGGVEGLEEAVVGEFERATRDHVLNRPVN